MGALLNASEIGVAVKNGIVTLSGQVDSYSKKLVAEKSVKRVAGVKAIAEDIQRHVFLDIIIVLFYGVFSFRNLRLYPILPDLGNTGEGKKETGRGLNKISSFFLMQLILRSWFISCIKPFTL